MVEFNGVEWIWANFALFYVGSDLNMVGLEENKLGLVEIRLNGLGLAGIGWG